MRASTAAGARRRRLDAASLARLFEQLALATRSGLPAAEALAIALKDTDADLRARQFLEALASDLSQGISLSDALKRSDAGLAPETVTLVRAAEGGTGLAHVLDLLAVDYQLEARFRSAVRAALAWPTFSFAALLVVGGLVMLVAIPTFEELFAAFGADLPGPTRLVVAISNVFGKGWFVVIPLILFAVWWMRRNDVIAGWMDGRLGGWTARIPVVGRHLARAFTTRLSSMLAATFAGAPVRESLAHLRATLSQPQWAASIAELEKRVAEGSGLPEAVAETTGLPSRLRVAVELGNRTQHLGTALAHAVAVSDEEFDRSLLRVEQALLVAGYVVVGLMVAFVVVALYLPIFKMGSAI